MKRRSDDDGRVVCSMDALDGRKKPALSSSAPNSRQKQRPEDELSKEQLRYVLRGATLAALVVALIFSAVLVLFVLFCTKVWFR